MKNSRKKVVFLLLALTLLLPACGQEKVAEPIPTPPQPTEKMEDAIVPTEPPTTETKEATEDYSTVNENDVIHAEIESAAIDNNRHLIVTDKNQKQHDKGYVGGDENVRGYVVSFLDYDGTPVKVEIVEKNGSATPPVPPKHTELNFLAWEGSWENIQGDTVITASYTPRGIYYTVRYCDKNGNLLHTEIVKTGNAPKGYEPASEEGMIFAGWDGGIFSFGEDVTLCAQYVPEESFALTLSSATVKGGETAELTLSVRRSPGISGLSVNLAIPDSIALESFFFYEAPGGMGTGPEKLPKSGEIKFNWFNIDKELSGEAMLLNLSFDVPAGTPAGVYWLQMSAAEGDIVNKQDDELKAEFIMGRIIVLE